MKLSQKKVCGNCRGLNPVNGNCEFWIETKTKYIHPHIAVGYIPLKPCYKPLTYEDYFAVKKLYKNERS